jgi:hypothetical protein
LTDAPPSSSLHFDYHLRKGICVPATPIPRNVDSQMGLMTNASKDDNSSGRGTAVRPPWESDDIFDDAFEFLDDVHGAILLSRLERDVVDTPEFQRLFRLGQLGFVDLVYPTANHTRAVHSIGVCHWSKRLVDQLRKNSGSEVIQISPSERVLISLAGLLHDIPHGPFSHDIEKKTHHFDVRGQTTRLFVETSDISSILRRTSAPCWIASLKIIGRLFGKPSGASDWILGVFEAKRWLR